MLKGVDIGGSYVKVVWEDGRREKYRIKELKRNRSALLRRLKRIIQKGNPEGVGIAVAGFTSLGGVVSTSPNIPVLNGVDIPGLMGRRGMRIAVGNDVNLSAYGEWFFNYRESRSLILVAVGTGLGGGLVLEGQPYFGVTGTAMEIGHHTILKGGEVCSCGRKGCWEAYCSSYGLERIYRGISGVKRKDYEVVRRALAGDRYAVRAVSVFKDFLITGLVNLVHIFNPDRIVLGGGLITGMKDLIGDIDSLVKKRAEELSASGVRIEFSRMGEFGGAYGALAFIKSRVADK